MTIADEKYVSLTTLRRNGQAVVTPVWIAPLAGGRAGFTTDGSSGKVKRIRNNSHVTLQPCSMRGTVTPGTAAVGAAASIVEGAELDPVRAAIASKYGLIVTLMRIPTAITKLFGRKDDSVGVLLTFDEAG